MMTGALTDGGSPGGAAGAAAGASPGGSSGGGSSSGGSGDSPAGGASAADAMGGVGGDASSSRRGSEKVLKAVRKASYTRRRSYKPAESWTAHYKQVAEEEGRLSGADKMTAAARRLIQVGA
eukprot:3744544-Prymnesium_polylepis.1